MKKYVMLFLCIFVFVGISGCATQDVSLSQASRESIHAVSVDPTIPVANRAQYSGSAGTRAASGVGLIGLAFAAAVVEPSEDKIQKAVNRRDIQLNKIFYQKFQDELQDQTDFKLVHSTYSDAVFKLAVPGYGFSEMGLKQGTLPFVDVSAELVDKQGKVLWYSSKEVILNEHAYYGHTLKEYLNNRALMVKAFDALMSHASDKIVSTLNN
jgi:hypothetical protein